MSSVSDQRTSDPPPSLASPSRIRSVLVAEDEAVNRMYLVAVLRKLGYRVEAVDDGLAAIDAWRKSPFDCLLLDLQMPRMTGEQVIAAIREDEKASGRHTLVVALTAHSLAGDCERILAQGFDAFLPKPVDPAGLRTQLEALGESRCGE